METSSSFAFVPDSLVPSMWLISIEPVLAAGWLGVWLVDGVESTKQKVLTHQNGFHLLLWWFNQVYSSQWLLKLSKKRILYILALVFRLPRLFDAGCLWFSGFIASPTTRMPFKTAKTGPTARFLCVAANKCRSQLNFIFNWGPGIFIGHSITGIPYNDGTGNSTALQSRNSRWHDSRAPASAPADISRPPLHALTKAGSAT